MKACTYWFCSLPDRSETELLLVAEDVAPGDGLVAMSNGITYRRAHDDEEHEATARSKHEP